MLFVPYFLDRPYRGCEHFYFSIVAWENALHFPHFSSFFFPSLIYFSFWYLVLPRNTSHCPILIIAVLPYSTRGHSSGFLYLFFYFSHLFTTLYYRADLFQRPLLKTRWYIHTYNYNSFLMMMKIYMFWE